MHKKQWTLALIAALTLPGMMVASSMAAEHDPIAHWKLDETSGTTAADSVGTYTGIYGNTPTLGEPGIAPPTGKSILVDDSQPEYMEVPYTADLNTLVFSINLWVKPTDDGRIHQTIADSFESGQEADPKFRNGWRVYMDPDGTVQMYLGYGNSFHGTSNSTDALTFNEWNHLVFQLTDTKEVTGESYQYTTDPIAYINGYKNVLGDDKPFDPNQGMVSPPKGLFFGAAGNLSTTNSFEGGLDDIHYYDYALDQLQVSYMYANPGSTAPYLPPPETMYWADATGDFNDTGPTHWEDAGGSPAPVPGSFDTAMIENEGTATITSANSVTSLLVGHDGRLGASFGHVNQTGGIVSVVDEIAVGSNVSGTSSYTMSGGQLNLASGGTGLVVGRGASGSMTLSGTAQVSLGASASFGVETDSGSGNGSLTIRDSASLTMTTANTALNVGTADVGGIGTTGVGTISIESGTLTLAPGTSHLTNLLAVGATGKGAGAVYQTGGTLASSTTATPDGYNYVLGGVGSDDSEAYGYYSLSGDGQINSPRDTLRPGFYGIGVVDQSGGTVIAIVRMATYEGSMGAYNLTGGTVTHTSETDVNTTVMRLTRAGTGNLNISGTGSMTVGAGLYVQKSTGQGVVNLGAVDDSATTDGVLATTKLYKHADATLEQLLNFHGGTLKVVAPLEGEQPELMCATDEVAETYGFVGYVYGDGAVVDTNGLDTTIGADLKAPTGNGVATIAVAGGGSDYIGAPFVKITGDGYGATAKAVVSGGAVTSIVVTNPGTDYTTAPAVELVGGGSTMAATIGTVDLNLGNASGGLTKIGLGTLTLAGTNTYTGLTDVQAGTLAITGSVAGDVDVQVGAMLKSTTTDSGSGMVGGDVDLDGTLDVEYDGGAGTVSQLEITGDLDLGAEDNAMFNFTDAGTGTLAEGDYVFVIYDGDLIGGPASHVGLLPGWSVEYDYDYDGGIDNAIALIVIDTLIPGDTEPDNDVDADDLAVVAAHWGDTVGANDYTVGNFNGDTVVDAIDAAIQAANWTGPGEGGTAPVPEPSAMGILLLGFTLVLRLRWRGW